MLRRMRRVRACFALAIVAPVYTSLVRRTDAALEKLKRGSFDAIISDMGRPPDRAGYTLMDKLRVAGEQTPFIIYAVSRDPEHRAEAIQHGAIGCTNRPDELFEMVLRAIGRVER